MPAFTLNLPTGTYEDLRSIAEAAGLPMADVVRPEIERAVWARKLARIGRGGAVGHMSEDELSYLDEANRAIAGGAE